MLFMYFLLITERRGIDNGGVCHSFRRPPHMHWYSSGITLSRSPTQSPTTTTTTSSSSSCCSAGRTDKKNESIHWAYQAGGLLSETVPNLNQSQPPHCPSDCSFPDSRSRSLFVPRFFSHTHEETNFIWGGEMFRPNRLQQSLIHCLALSSSLSRSFPSRSAEHVTVVIHRFSPPPILPSTPGLICSQPESN